MNISGKIKLAPSNNKNYRPINFTLEKDGDVLNLKENKRRGDLFQIVEDVTIKGDTTKSPSDLINEDIEKIIKFQITKTDGSKIVVTRSH